MRILCAALLLLPACSRDSYKTPVDLPFSDQIQSVDTDGWVVLHLTRDGSILLGDEPVSLEELDSHLHEESSVLACIDKDAPFVHAGWLFDTLERNFLVRFWIGAQRGGRNGALPASVDAFWSHDWELRGPPDDDGPLMALTVPGMTIDVGVDEEGYVLRGSDEATDDPAVLRRWLRRERRASARHWKSPPVGVLTHVSDLRFARFIAGLSLFHSTGMRDVVWGEVAAHPWVRSQRRLPTTDGAVVVPFDEFAGWPRLNVLLPPAPAAEEDKDDDEDDRICFELNDHGQILYKNKAISLDELGARLENAKRLYELKMRRLGKVAFEAGWSKLFVLLSADRNVPWAHVQWIVKILHEQKIYKLQFGVSRWADLSYARGEAERLGAPTEESVPCAYRYQAKQPVFLPVGTNLREAKLRVRILARPHVSYVVKRRETTSLEELAGWLRELASDDLAEVRADPEVPHKFVVAIVDRLHAARVRIVDIYEDVEIPPDVRAAPALPRPTR
jgi:biopolymer transport protein ExbD